MATNQFTTFIIDGFHSFGVHVKADAEAAIKALGDDKIWFTRVAGEDKAAFTTSEPAVIKYLRGIKNDLSVTLREDLRQYQALRCPQCGFTTEGNSAADQKALAEHIANEHDLDEQEPVTSKPKLEERAPEVVTEVVPKDDAPKSNVKTGKITAGQ